MESLGNISPYYDWPPGENIRSTKIGTGYATWDGSSMATIVGSVIGLMKSFNPSWNQEQLITMV